MTSSKTAKRAAVRATLARAAVSHLRDGTIPKDAPVRKICTHVALILASLKNLGRVYTATLVDPEGSKRYVIGHVHGLWMQHVAPLMQRHLEISASTYESIMQSDISHAITSTLPGCAPMSLHLRGVSDDACTDGPDECMAVTLFRCLTCQSLYKSPVNAARCAATHAPARGSRQGRRRYDADAVAAFWDGLSPGRRLDLFEDVLPMVSTSVLTMSGAKLLTLLDDRVCEGLLLVMVHETPYKVPAEDMSTEDIGAFAAYMVIDGLIQAMAEDAAAKERALLEELDSEASRHAQRQAEKEAKKKARRQTKEARRGKALVSRLAHDDALFRSWIPGCSHWFCDDDLH